MQINAAFDGLTRNGAYGNKLRHAPIYCHRWQHRCAVYINVRPPMKRRSTPRSLVFTTRSLPRRLPVACAAKPQLLPWHSFALERACRSSRTSRFARHQGENRLARRPNHSLKLTRYSRLCKPGPRYAVHVLGPGLQSLPPRAA
jgi:hypothetical protein